MSSPLLHLTLLNSPTKDHLTPPPLDLLIFLPHAELFSPNAPYLTHFPKITPLDPVALERFCYMDADIGSRELAHSLGEKLSATGLSVGILDVKIPRSIADFNRTFDRAVPPLWHNPDFQTTFDAAQAEIVRHFSRSRHVIHMHTMASNERTETWEPEKAEEFTRERVEKYAENAYSGAPRRLNQLTGDRTGQEYVDGRLSHMIETALSEAGYEHARNESYSLEPCYPTTRCLLTYPGSAFDIVKKYVATPETRDEKNPGKVRIDPTEVERLSAVLAGVYARYLAPSRTAHAHPPSACRPDPEKPKKN
jgi:hypothetical protein